MFLSKSNLPRFQITRVFVACISSSALCDLKGSSLHGFPKVSQHSRNIWLKMGRNRYFLLYRFRWLVGTGICSFCWGNVHRYLYVTLKWAPSNELWRPVSVGRMVLKRLMTAISSGSQRWKQYSVARQPISKPSFFTTLEAWNQLPNETTKP